MFIRGVIAVQASAICRALDENSARDWIGNASARHVYYIGETVDQNGAITWGTHPSCACGILRETHVSQLGSNMQSSLQTENRTDYLIFQPFVKEPKGFYGDSR